MEIMQKSSAKRYILLAIFGLVLFLVSLKVVVDRQLELAEEIIVTQLAEQEVSLREIAEITARNAADETTERIVKDCLQSDRAQFDSLLGRLDAGLSQSELLDLERLFGRCGSYYAERKALMTNRLEREIEVFESYVAQLSALSGSAKAGDYKLEEWKTLGEEEKKQSDLFSSLVTQQDKIIAELLTGKSAKSPEIMAVLTEVQSTQESLAVTNKQIATLRSELATN